MNNQTISLLFTYSKNCDDNIFSISRKTLVKFEHDKKINIIKALENIYRFRNFLMILLKRSIVVKKQYVCFEGKKYCLFDCKNDELARINKSLEEHLNHRCLKIETY